jgi:type I restriction enzyme S subunit
VVIKIKQLKEGVSEGTPRSAPDAIDKKYWIEPGDLLMSWSAHLGIYWWMNEPGLLNQHLFKVTSISDYSTIYLLYALDRAMPQFWDRAQGTTMRHIKRAALTEVQTLAPPRAVAEQFTGVVGPLVTSMMRLKQGADALASIRDLLLPKLVTGQIDVSDLDLDAVVERAVG